MCRKAFLSALVLLAVVSAVLAGEAWFKLTQENGEGMVSQWGPGAYLAPGPLPEARSREEAPDELCTGEEWWLLADEEDIYIGNPNYLNVAAALEFINDDYRLVRVKAIRYNFSERWDGTNTLRGHVWDDDGTGEPRWLDDTTSIKNFDLHHYRPGVDWQYNLDPPYPEFDSGKHFWVGWQVKNWGGGNYGGWNHTGVPPYYSWWWDTTEWYKIIEPHHYPLPGDWTMEVLVQCERYDYDASTQSIDEVGPLVPQGGVVIPKATVLNNGQQTVDFDVTCTITPGAYSSTVHTPPLAAGEIYRCTFSKWQVPQECGCEYTVEVRTKLPGDQYPANDCISELTSAYSFWEGFELSDGKFEPEPLTGGWQWGKPIRRGCCSLKCWATRVNENYGNNVCWKLTSCQFVAQPGPRRALVFKHKYDIETYHDGGNVKLSVKGGPWTLIHPLSPYPEDAVPSANACIPLEPAFCGLSGPELAWFDLTDLVSPGDRFFIRWDFGSDYSVKYPGWFIDDVYGICFLSLAEPDLAIHGEFSDVEGKHMPLTSAISLSQPLGTPNAFALFQNQPNPFGKLTIINYQLPMPGHTTLSIYDVSGRLVKNLVDERKVPGYYTVSWDGKDNSGRLAPTGVYFYRLRSGECILTKKLLLLR